MFGTIGWPEIILILLVVLLLFGAKRLPEMGRALGKGIREFKRSIKGLEDELDAPEKEEKKNEDIKA
ncbi:MAG: twin-arginine translocase TatA/TatE family subunit [Caldiserica bacterium]|nr:twin-arginine translocase TatA/TatE family subunit [candidate division WOR-3 bacterium]RLD13911.1 MAG: twin-arginine translocase TatA/TatE family subunit [Caldisericota bacterium]